MANVLTVGANRIWLIEGKAGPANEPQYISMGALGALDWPQGDVTKFERPSDLQYNQWIEAGSFQGSADRVTSTLTTYETIGRSTMLTLIRKKCALDLQIHKGICTDPRDFDGFEKVWIVPNVLLSSFASAEQGALEGEGQAASTEEVGVSGTEIIEVLRMAYTEVAQTQVGEAVVAVDVCDSINCGDCEGTTQSDGCQRVFAVTDGSSSSPGVLPQVVATGNSFSTIVESWISTAAIGTVVNDAGCVGANFVVLVGSTPAIHYASSQDIIDGVASWTKVTTGLTTEPLSIYNYSPLNSFISGKSGYVYAMSNPADGVTTLDAGVAAGAVDLEAINGYDAENVAAVGTNIAIYSRNGLTFSAMTTSPTAALKTVAYRTINEIWMGGTGATVYYTSDYGAHWATKSFPAAVTGVKRIVWANSSVGFILANTASGGRVYRTINGGYSWYLAPENASLSVPTNSALTDIVICEPNKVFIGGTAQGGADGILIKGTD